MVMLYLHKPLCYAPRLIRNPSLSLYVGHDGISVRVSGKGLEALIPGPKEAAKRIQKASDKGSTKPRETSPEREERKPRSSP